MDLSLLKGRLMFRSTNIVVVLQPLADEEGKEWRILGRELLNLLFGIAVLSHGIPFEAINETEEDLQIRFVLQPSTYEERFEKFLKVRAERDCLDATFLRRKKGSVVVEVADEKARGWVEVGRDGLAEEQRELVEVEVGGARGWERWVGYQ